MHNINILGPGFYHSISSISPCITVNLSNLRITVSLSNSRITVSLSNLRIIFLFKSAKILIFPYLLQRLSDKIIQHPLQTVCHLSELMNLHHVIKIVTDFVTVCF